MKSAKLHSLLDWIGGLLYYGIYVSAYEMDVAGRLLMVGPTGRLLRTIHQLLDKQLLDNPGFWGWLWRLFHRPDWQKSARFNARIWVVGFSIFYPLASQWGNAWWINLGVTLSLDVAVYVFHKNFVWFDRRVILSRSYFKWALLTSLTFAVNLGSAWMLLNQTDVGKGGSKVLLAAVGVLINPWIFTFRDRVALRDVRSETEMA